MRKHNIEERMTTWGGMPFIRIPAGPFIMGSREENPLAYSDEMPQHILQIHYDYWISRYPIRNSDFSAFVRATRHVTRAETEGWCWVWNPEVMEWEQANGASWTHPLGAESIIRGMDHHPVVQVCWYDALVYCAWLNHEYGQDLPQGYRFRLPSEAEWEKAARGSNGREWPWGNEFDLTLCNCREGGKVRTIETGSHSPRSDSPYGVADMGGNAWEWTTTLWGDDREAPAFVYPYTSRDGREQYSVGEAFYRIIRGGSYKDDRRGVRSACRDLDPPHYSLSNLGFRVLAAPDIQEVDISVLTLE